MPETYLNEILLMYDHVIRLRPCPPGNQGKLMVDFKISWNQDFLSQNMYVSRKIYEFAKIIFAWNLPKRNTLNVWSCDPVKTLPPWQSRQVNGWWWALVEEINSNRRSSSDLKKLVLSQPSKDTPLPVRTWSEKKNIIKFVGK